MPRFLVPVDFSTVSVNAALYAVKMAEKMPKKEVVLYNVTEGVHAADDGTPLDFNGDAFLANNLRSLEHLQVSLFEMGLSPMEIFAEIGDLPEKIKPTINQKSIDMIVMGVKGETKNYGDSFFGRNAMDISKSNSCPVMIVPADAVYRDTNKVAIAVDLKDVDKNIAIAPMKKWLDILQPELHFVYVGASSETDLSPAQRAEKEKLEEMFKEYSFDFHILPKQEFSKAINEFVEKNQIEHIIVFPKRHGVIDGMFAANHTKKLAFHSHIPVLAIHE
jgi:nucleotide-binding universal stress UspA family protein